MVFLIGTLTQPKIILISVCVSGICMGLFITAMILPWYYNDEEGEITLFAAIYEGRSNGMYLLACLAAMLGGAVVCMVSILVFFFGDNCAAAIGMDWFASWLKNTMFRLCSTAATSACVTALFCGFQCREKGESMKMGYMLNIPICPLSLVGTCLLYYYPFAPSGGKGIFDDDGSGSDDDEDGSGGGGGSDDGSDEDGSGGGGGGGGWGGMGGLFGGGGKKKGSDDGDDDDDDDGSDEESEESAPKKKGKK